MFFTRNDDMYATTSGTMVILLYLLAMLHNGLTNSDYAVLEKHLLKQLGINRRPAVNKNVNIPSVAIELYKSVLKENIITTHFFLPGLHTKSANTARTYRNQGSAPNSSKSQKYRLQFDIRPLPERERIKAAEVRMTMFSNTRLHNDEFIHILVHDIVRPGTKGLSKPILRLIDSKSMHLSRTLKSEVISFDVTPAMERLSENNFEENHGIVVQCVSRNGTQLLSLFNFESTENDENPLLMIYSDDGTTKEKEISLSDAVERRSKRSTDESSSSRKSKKKTCQKYPLYVNFTEVEWDDWITAPPGYDAYYCDGECTFPLADHMNASNHAVVQTLISMDSRSVPQACCVPTKLQPQALLYTDNDMKTVLKNYPDMIVEECGCR